MKKTFFTFILLIFVSGIYAQQKFTISGYVKDHETGEFLIGSTVYIKEKLKGISTNQYGFYSITIEEGNYTIDFSFLGLQSQQKKINLDKIEFVGYAFQIEMKFTSWKYGFNIIEVPVIFTDRQEGNSKMSGGIFYEALFGVIKMKVKSFFKNWK